MTAYLLWVLVVGGSNSVNRVAGYQPYVVPMKFVHLRDCQAIQKSMERNTVWGKPRTQCVQVLVKD